MKMKTLTAGLVVSAAALGTAGVGSSMAATLYTSKTHTTPVAVGTTAIGKSGVVSLYSGKTKVNSCKSSTLNLSVTQNSSGTVAAQITGGSFNTCSLATTISGTPWSPGLVVTGSGVVTGTKTVWSNTSVGGVSVQFAGGTYTGNLNTNITASEPTGAGAPLTLTLKKTGTLTGPLTSDGVVTATYKLTGAAAKYSLGN